MATPMKEDGSVNYDTLEKLVEDQIAGGTDAIISVGTSGEAPTLEDDEHLEVIRFCVEKAAGRIPVIAGTGSNNTANSVETTKIADELGVDGFLIVGPYYNKPTQEGYYQHFKAISECTAKPIILYNVPGRTAANIPPATVARIAKDFKNVVAIKEAAGNVAQVAELFRILPADFTIYSGDDGLLLPFASVGATGVVSVLANIGGEILQDLMNAYESGDVKKAAEINKKMVPLANAMFIETNPIPVKAAVTLVTGIDAGAPRLPLTPMTEGALAKMKGILAENGLI
jgi:4-hydroxy-tetrahydrodipicolinate synthase